MDRLPGRETDLARLTAAVQDLRRGRGGLVWIEGAPGAGKTTLVETAIEAARDQGIGIYQAVAEEAPRTFPLRLFADLFGRRAPESIRVGAGDPLVAAISTIVEVVARRCAAGPMLLVLEDLQWPDDESLAAWSR